MMPFFRSLNELKAITQTRANPNKRVEKNELQISSRIRDNQFKVDKNSQTKKKIILPTLPISKRRKWIKSKEAVSKFFNDLDYNNQIQSSLDLTLLESQQSYEQQDIA